MERGISMKITNVNVWGLEESIIASGYPMTNGRTPDHYDKKFNQGLGKSDWKRAKNLGSVDIGTGYDGYLKGIIVQFDWRISQVIYPQVERYHFIDIVSSQSKMHRIHLAKRQDFNEHVDPIILDRFMELLDEYNNLDPIEDQIEKAKAFQRLVYSCPMGYEMTARFTTNYLQLKTIYQQRKNHKLGEWKEFCKWIETLPYFKELTQKRVD